VDAAAAPVAARMKASIISTRMPMVIASRLAVSLSLGVSIAVSGDD
jgi:hypothetical protein